MWQRICGWKNKKHTHVQRLFWKVLCLGKRRGLFRCTRREKLWVLYMYETNALLLFNHECAHFTIYQQKHQLTWGSYSYQKPKTQTLKSISSPPKSVGITTQQSHNFLKKILPTFMLICPEPPLQHPKSLSLLLPAAYFTPHVSGSVSFAHPWPHVCSGSWTGSAAGRQGKQRVVRRWWLWEQMSCWRCRLSSPEKSPSHTHAREMETVLTQAMSSFSPSGMNSPDGFCVDDVC